VDKSSTSLFFTDKAGSTYALSRRPEHQVENNSTDHSILPLQVSATTLTFVPRNTAGDSYLKKKQLEDEVVGPILRAMETQSKPDTQILRGQRETYQLAQLWDQSVIREQILYRKFEGENGKKSYLQLVVP